VILAPSILAADLSRLGEQIQAVERGGAGLVHVDVMDGHFVPNISMGPVVVAACRRVTQLPIDAHLMIENAEKYLDAFVDAGASSVSVHVEALTHLQRAVAHLRERGVSPGVAAASPSGLTAGATTMRRAPRSAGWPAAHERKRHARRAALASSPWIPATATIRGRGRTPTSTWTGTVTQAPLASGATAKSRRWRERGGRAS
jgi:hypothetical protein